MNCPRPPGGRDARIGDGNRVGAGVAAMFLVVFLLAACGPESFHRGAPSDGSPDQPADGAGTGGASGEGGAGGGTDGGTDAGSCPNGMGGARGDAAVPTFTSSWTFDGPGSLQGWAPVGQPPEVVAATTVVLDDQDGFPCAGSAHLMIPFAGASQQVAYGFGFSAPQDFSGKVLSARVRLNSNNASGTVMAGLAYKSVTGVYLFASSAVPTIVSSSGWVTFTLSFDHPDGFVDPSHHDADGGVIPPDPKTVLEIDVLILTGSPPFMTTDVSIDTIGVSDSGI
jgi:hypothetical protein